MANNLHDRVEKAKETFRELISKNAHQDTIDLLVSLREENQLDPEDTGWVLWNLCDRHALLRWADAQHGYQSEFWKWCEVHFPSRLHWVVTDGSQAMTLIDNGYSADWWQWYELANKQSPRTDENRGARFESHRANAYAYTRFSEIEKAGLAFHNMRELLAEDEGWVNRDFAMVTYHSLLTDFHAKRGDSGSLSESKKTAEIHLTKWLKRSEPEQTTTEKAILGSWYQLNSTRPPSAVFTAIHNFACALARAKQYAPAEKFFRLLLERDRRLTPYARAQYILACWSNRKDENEVRGLLSAASDLKPETLKKYAPQLSCFLETT